MVCKKSAIVLALSFSATLVGCLGSGKSSSSTTTPPTVTAIALTPQNDAVTVGKTLQMSAQATYSDGSKKDVTSTATWQTSDSTVATVSAGNVSAVKAGVVDIHVSSGQVSATTIVNVTSKSFSKSSLKGAYAFTLTTGMGAALQFEVGSLNADGNGNISGVEDLNAPSGTSTAVSASGTYTITADGRGTLTLTTSGQAARTMRFVLSANSAAPGGNNGILIEFDGSHNAIGRLEKQDQTAFDNASLASASYVFRFGGLDGSQQPTSSMGTFTADSTGSKVSSGIEDVNDNGAINNGAGSGNAVPLTGGNIGSVDATTGRATASLVSGAGTSNFAFYLVSPSKIEIVGLDKGPVIGTAELQARPAPAAIGAGGYLVQTDIGGVPGQFWLLGQVGVDSTSHFTQGVLAQDGAINVAFTNPSAAITVAANGRGTFQQSTNHGSLACTFYMISSNKMYLLQTNDPHAGSGTLELQSPGPDGFPSINLNNTFVAGGAELGDGNVAFVAQYVSDGLGHIMGLEDVSQPQSGNPSQLSASTIIFKANYGAPNSIGGIQFTLGVPGAGVTGLSAVLQSSSAGAFVGQPNDVDGRLKVQ